MKIALASDLHIEFGTIEIPNTQQARVLILSGDILLANILHSYKTTEQSAKEIEGTGSNKQRLAIRFRSFLRHVSNEFQDVIYVLGNHEYYGGKFPDAVDWLKEEVKNYKNIHVLENDNIEIDEVTFVGCTLWTNMKDRDPLVMQLISNMMNDFSVIRNSQENYRTFLPQDAVNCHTISLDYIRSIVDSDPKKTYVVVGHHGPSPLSIHPMYKEKVFLNAGYVSDLSEFIFARPQIKLWTSGHTHHSYRYYLDKTLVACNPRGYVGYEDSANTFTLKYVDLNNMPLLDNEVDWGWNQLQISPYM